MATKKDKEKDDSIFSKKRQEKRRDIQRKVLTGAPGKPKLKSGTKKSETASKKAKSPKKAKRRTTVLSQLRQPLRGFKKGPVRSKKEREQTAKDLKRLRKAFIGPPTTRDMTPLANVADQLHDTITDYWVGERKGGPEGYQKLRAAGQALRGEHRDAWQKKIDAQLGVQKQDRKEDFNEITAERARQQFVDQGRIALALQDAKLSALAAREKQEKQSQFQKKMDENRAALEGDFVKNATTIKNLRGALKILESPETIQQGWLESQFDDPALRGWANYLTMGGEKEFAKREAVRNLTRSEATRTLRQALGGQFAFREGEAVILTVYNPRATDAQNIRAIKQFLTAYEASIKQMQLLQMQAADPEMYAAQQARIIQQLGLALEPLASGGFIQEEYGTSGKRSYAPLQRKKALRPGTEKAK